MKNLYFLFVALLVVSCSSTRMVDSWKNDAYTNFKPKRVLVVGITDHLTARKIFEKQLKEALQTKHIDAVESYNVFDSGFLNSKQSRADIEKAVKSFSDNGYDAVLISAVKGMDEKTTYSGDTFYRNYYWRRFGRYYYLYQDVYFVEGYYNKYKIYNVEASLFDLKSDRDKTLVWVASYKIVDPQKIETSVHEYVAAIIQALENENLIDH